MNSVHHKFGTKKKSCCKKVVRVIEPPFPEEEKKTKQDNVEEKTAHTSASALVINDAEDIRVPSITSVNRDLIAEVDRLLYSKKTDAKNASTPSSTYGNETRRQNLLRRVRDLEKSIDFNYKQITLLINRIRSGITTVDKMHLKGNHRFQNNLSFQEFLNAVTSYEQNLRSVEQSLEAVKRRLQVASDPATLIIEHLEICFQNIKQTLMYLTDHLHYVRNKVQTYKHDLTILCNQMRHVRISGVRNSGMRNAHYDYVSSAIYDPSYKPYSK